LNQAVESQSQVAAVAGERQSALASAFREGGIMLAASGLVAVSAHLSIPLWFTPVPVTLQPFAVLLVGLLLSPRVAFGAMVAYLAEGAAGLPVFTPSGPGGVLQLLGPTGGYLLSYPIVAPAVSWLWRMSLRTYSRAVIVAGIGSAITLAMGAAWLGLLTHAAPMTVLNHAVLPFLPGDLLKVAAAAAIAVGTTRFRQRPVNL
jgi:biotin transport system substrate-specific component